jgi:hypothetical protein
MASISEISPLIQANLARRAGITSTQLGDLSSAELDELVTQLKLGPAMARYRVGGFYGGEGPVSTLLLTNQVLVLGPILIEKYIVVDEIGIDVTTAGTEGSLYTALYRDRGDGYPGGLLYTSAALTSTPGAFKSTASLDVEMVPGLYWGGAVVNGVITTAPTVRSIATSSRFVAETAGANDINNAGYSESGVTGAPNTTFTATAAVVAQAPKILMKIKQG